MTSRKLSKKASFFVAAVICVFFIVGYWFTNRSTLESRFYNNEQAFQMAADAYISGKRYTGVKQWLKTMPPGEGAKYLPFHMSSDYVSDFYKPRIVYILSDNADDAALCSFDGKLIKKIKYQWYICKESRFLFERNTMIRRRKV